MDANRDLGGDDRRAWTAGPTLSVWTYDSPRGAAAGQVRLGRLCQRGAVVVVDAVTITWVHGAHRPRVGSTHLGGPSGPSRRSPLRAFLGNLLTPDTGTEGRAVDVLVRVGLDRTFLEQVRESVRPDTSSLVVLTRRVDLHEVRPVVERGTSRGDVRLLHTPITEHGLRALTVLTRDDRRP